MTSGVVTAWTGEIRGRVVCDVYGDSYVDPEDHILEGEVLNYQAFTNARVIYTVAETMQKASDGMHACLARPISNFNQLIDAFATMPYNVMDEDGSKNGHGEGNSKKESGRLVSPSSTLESSFESLNVKKFDGDYFISASSIICRFDRDFIKYLLLAVAFAVNPLYHQTSAQFNEGGAKGLLLNNLAIYGGCQVFYYSFEVSGKFMTSGNKSCNQDNIDISFAKDCIDKMVKSMGMSEEISPSLKHIMNLFDESSQRPPITFTSVDNVNEEFHETYNNTNDNVELDDTEIEDFATWGFENEDPNGEDPKVIEISSLAIFLSGIPDFFDFLHHFRSKMAGGLGTSPYKTPRSPRSQRTR
ncbi:condensin complex subunit 2-like [Impatiens glandulifera]|uniref:condensin complex subunit 2-like n=1 Tax=Impatiens glandulifera TaxID=253017 RepID=UPI001FB13FD2|nr:condensin complex subunit 2-like [Impatiens glandulifera]